MLEVELEVELDMVRTSRQEEDLAPAEWLFDPTDIDREEARQPTGTWCEDAWLVTVALTRETTKPKSWWPSVPA